MLHFAGRPRVVYTSADSSGLSTRGVQTVSLGPTRSQNLVPKGQTWSNNLGDLMGYEWVIHTIYVHGMLMLMEYMIYEYHISWLSLDSFGRNNRPSDH